MAASLLLLAGCGGGGDAQAFHGHVLDRPYEVLDTALTDTDGQPFSLAAQTDKRLTLLFFGYTRCDDTCPAVLNNLAVAMTRLDARDRDQVDVVLVSSDPEHDSEEALRTYLDQFDESFIGLRADLATTVDVGKPLAVGIDETNPGGHTTQVLGIDTADEVPVYWDQDTSPSEYAADIHSLLEDS